MTVSLERRPPPRRRGLLAAVALTAALLAACAQDPDAVAALPDQVPTIAGRVVERLDEPPFSYLKLRTEHGLVWVGVPVGARAVGDLVRVTGCVAAKNLKLRTLNARLPRVYLGSLGG